jgi:hypothetical protein
VPNRSAACYCASVTICGSFPCGILADERQHRARNSAHKTAGAPRPPARRITGPDAPALVQLLASSGQWQRRPDLRRSEAASEELEIESPSTLIVGSAAALKLRDPGQFMQRAGAS